MSTPDLRTCDIVMKGGITSGVVYPQAITRLAKRFRFVNIGGTSAGAIAAAIAAAAEYRRHEKNTEDGFQRLDALPELLGQKVEDSERTRLFRFFQPNAGTRRPFAVITSTLGRGTGAFRAALRQAAEEYAGWTCLGLLPGLILGVASVCFATGPMVFVWAAVSLALCAVGAVLGAVAGFAREFIREVPRNGYGLCSGFTDPAATGTVGGAEPLSVWLATYLDETAGLPRDQGPLTFGHLWNTDEADPEKAVRRTNLEMMTTNLTHGRPYRLPFRDDEDLHENYRFYFRPDEFRCYFPESIVQWMIDHPRPVKDKPENIARRQLLKEHGFLPLPKPADLPVVVATRMSLSFPVLLSAVPLHGFVDEGKQTGQLPARCWFSDGGMCSNFPLHFFDSSLPRRPTFSIDLIDHPGEPADSLKPEMDESNDILSERWNQFDFETASPGGSAPALKPDLDRLLGFFWAIIATMQNWTDTTQARLPGYRDRIVRVPLSPQEGGLNLDMPEALIKALSARGGEAAGVLLQHFDVPPGHKVMTWDNHRWIRLRSLFGSLEKTLRSIQTASLHPENHDLSYEDWLQEMKKNPEAIPGSYTMTRAQIAAALKSLEALREIPGLWPEQNPASKKAPRPRPIFRPRAQI